MNKKTKKGFTLVELLVVIAILAILATVSVVGYTSFIDKANQSVDQQTVTQMNKVLLAEGVVNKDGPVDGIEVKALLAENGFNTAFQPAYSGYKYGWLKTEKVVVLVNTKENKIAYPEGYDGVAIEGNANFEFFNVVVAKNAADLAEKIAAVQNGTSAVSSIVLTDNITISETAALEIGTGKKVEIDLNGKTLDSNAAEIEADFRSTGSGNLTITNGTITTSATATLARGTSTLTLVNTTLVTTGNTYAVSTNGSAGEDSTVYIENCTIKGSYALFAPSGTWVITNSTFEGRSHIAGNNITIENCKFISTGSSVAHASTGDYTNLRTDTSEVAEWTNGNTTGALTAGDALLITVNRSETSYITENITIKNCKFSFKNDVDESWKAYGLRILDLGKGSIDAHAVVHLEGNTYENYTGCSLGDVAVFQSVPTGATEAFN